MQRTTIDEDGSPVWPVVTGESLVDGVLAWERLAVGVRCETWLGWSEPLWCPVVVKVARPHQCGNERTLRSLGREVTALQGNPHPALPRLIAEGVHAAVPHLVLEYLDGPSLDELIDRNPLDGHATALLGVQLLAATMSLHRRGLAHLDVKPENVVVRDARPMLVDFGSARPLGARQPAGHPVGTVGYAAPEMEACAPIGSAMDVYGIGATLRETFTGLSIYDLDPARQLAALQPLASADHPALATLINAMLAEKAADRPSVPAALETLGEWLAVVDLRPWPVGVHAMPVAPSS